MLFEIVWEANQDVAPAPPVLVEAATVDQATIYARLVMPPRIWRGHVNQVFPGTCAPDGDPAQPMVRLWAGAFEVVPNE